MENTNMTFTEVVDFTDFKLRPATTEEIELVLSVIATSVFLQDQSKKEKRVPTSHMAKKIEEIIESSRTEIQNTSYILDFPLQNKKIFVFHQMQIGLQDHGEVRNLLGSFMQQQPDEFTEHFNKSTTPHNHLGIIAQYLLINPDNDVKPINIVPMNLCLKKYPKE